MIVEDADFNELMGAMAGMAAESAEARRAGGAAAGEIAAGWLTPNYLLALRKQLAERPAGPARFKLLRQAASDVATFQRGSVWAARLELEREKLEFQRQKHRDRITGHGPDGPRRDPNAPMTEAELKACVDKVDEIFGLKRVPDGPAEAEAARMMDRRAEG